MVQSERQIIDAPAALDQQVFSISGSPVAGLGGLWILQDEERQAWHDKIAGRRRHRTDELATAVEPSFSTSTRIKRAVSVEKARSPAEADRK